MHPRVAVPQLQRGPSEVIIEMVKRNLIDDITLERPLLKLLRQSRLEVMSKLSQASTRHGSLRISMLCLTCQPKSCKSSPHTNGCITSIARCSSRNWDERARRHLSTTFPRPNAPYFLTADTISSKPYMSTLTRQPRRPRFFPHRDRQCCHYQPILAALLYQGFTFLANRCRAKRLRHPCQLRHPRRPSQQRHPSQL